MHRFMSLYQSLSHLTFNNLLRFVLCVCFRCNELFNSLFYWAGFSQSHDCFMRKCQYCDDVLIDWHKKRGRVERKRKEEACGLPDVSHPPLFLHSSPASSFPFLRWDKKRGRVQRRSNEACIFLRFPCLSSLFIHRFCCIPDTRRKTKVCQLSFSLLLHHRHAKETSNRVNNSMISFCTNDWIQTKRVAVSFLQCIKRAMKQCKQYDSDVKGRKWEDSCHLKKLHAKSTS